MKREAKTEMKKTTIVLILSLTLLLGGNLQPASAANLERVNFTLHLSITPSHVMVDSQPQSIGYIYILNTNGVSITPDSNVEITLISDNPTIASVPDKVIFPADATYVKFDVTTGKVGQTTITATLKNQIGFTDIRVGTDRNTLPDNLSLEINLPTDKMHVNSEMPFSVFLKIPDELDDRGRVEVEGTVIRAPFDIEIILDYEKSLATPNDDLIPGDRVAVYLQNQSVGPVTITEVLIAGLEYVYPAIAPTVDLTAIGGANSPANGEYFIVKQGIDGFPAEVSIEATPVLAPGEEVSLLFTLEDSLTVGRDAQIKITTANGAVFVGTLISGQQSG